MHSSIGRTRRRKSSLLSFILNHNTWCTQNGRDFPGGWVRIFENIIPAPLVTDVSTLADGSARGMKLNLTLKATSTLLTGSR